MKRSILLIGLVTLLFIIPLICAEQIYNKIYLNPFYTNAINQYQRYNFNVTINPTDKVGTVVSALLTFHTYARPSVGYNLTVNNQWCNNRWYNISTTDAGAAMADLFFDCSNIINTAGTYNISLWSNKAGGATTAWLDLVYSNSPPGSVTIHGTEYTNKQIAKPWLQLINSTGDYINTGVCYVDIYTPAGGYYLEGGTMTNMNHDGIYYYDMPAPLIEGVYPVIAKCYYLAGQTFFYPNSYFTQIGTYDSGLITDTYTVNNVFIRFKESTVNPVRNISVGVNFTSGPICSNISSSLLTGISARIVGRFDSVSNDDITVSIYNYTSSTWLTLPNKLLEGNTWMDFSNSLLFNNITTAGLVNSTGSGLKLKFVDTNYTDGATSNLDLDLVQLSCDQLTSPVWQSVKGSSEIHVSSTTSDEPYYSESLCGDASVNGHLSVCSEFLNNASYWNTTWGYIHDQILFINNYQTAISEIEIYETPLGQDCTSLINITETRDNVTRGIMDEVTLSLGNTRDNCIIGIPVEFNSTDREFYVDIYEDNYMRWEVQRDKDFTQSFRLQFEDYCDIIATQSDNPFTIPIDSLGSEVDVSSLYADNPVYLGCYRVLDDMYWFDLYYNDSLGITVSGEYESYLSEIRYYYPELRFHAQNVQQLISGDVFTTVETLCGASVSYTGYNYGCAEIKVPDAVFSSQEGYIMENLTVTNKFNATINTVFTYDTARGVDCTAVFQVLKQNGTTTDIVDDIIYRSSDADNCQMNIPISYVQGEASYQIEIYMENYIYWDIYWARDLVNSLNDTVLDFCTNVSIAANVTYQIPINQSIDAYRNNSELYFCYRAVDDIYWWYFFYDKLLAENYTTIGPTESIHYESEFFWPRILDDYNTIKTYERDLNQVQTLDAILDLRENMSQRVWNYTERNLTYYGAGSDPAMISNYVWNATNRSLTYTDNLASAVWNYSGTIGVNVIQTLVNNTWSYTGTIGTNLLNQMGDSVWSFNGNSSTFMVQTVVNSTWEYTGGRYTHGVILN
jgi:hypothetical protein